jgi:hypothetical protein
VNGQKLWIPAEPTEFDLNSIRNDPVKLASIRKRLSDISWWMRLRCQYVAMRANGEEGEGLGRFWQSRFKAVRILDEEPLLACAAYVDLNPLRAALAETLETSGESHPWLPMRKGIQTSEASEDSRGNYPRADEFLSPVAIDERNDPLGPRPSRSKKRCSDKGFLAMTEADYLTILDWLVRNTVDGKRGSTPANTPAIFDRLGIDSAAWSQMVKSFGRSFKNVAGKPSSIAEARSVKTLRRFYCSRV